MDAEPRLEIVDQPDALRPAVGFVDELAAKYDAGAGAQAAGADDTAHQAGGEGGGGGAPDGVPSADLAALEESITVLAELTEEFRKGIGRTMAERREIPPATVERLVERLSMNESLKTGLGRAVAKLLAKLSLVRSNPELAGIAILIVADMVGTMIVLKQIAFVPLKKKEAKP